MLLTSEQSAPVAISDGNCVNNFYIKTEVYIVFSPQDLRSCFSSWFLTPARYALQLPSRCLLSHYAETVGCCGCTCKLPSELSPIATALL